MSGKKRQKKEDIHPQAEAPPQAEGQTPSLEAERDDLLARLQRVSADYLNYQKRMQRDVEQARQFSNEGLIKSLLSVLDDMEHGLASGRQNHDPDDPLLKGMEMVRRKAMEILGKFGLERIEAEGRPFDPDQHSAMMQEPSDQHPAQTVLRELQAGYRLKGRTIRPSSVVVSHRPDDADQATDSEDADDRPAEQQ